MAYFRELPNLKYISVFKDRNLINEYTDAKNLFKRPKLREDIKEIITAFEYYQIIGDERADQIAEKYYSNSELDWIVLITNNITNTNEQWPLDNDSLYKYMLDKYGSDEKIQEIHHYETIEFKDEFGRVLIEGGIQVDPSKSEVIETNETDTEYQLSSFPNSKANEIISVNLNQMVKVYSRGNSIPTEYYITTINVNTSTLNYIKRDSNVLGEVSILNSLANWPNSWGGIIKVKTNSGEDVNITIEDVILDNKVRIPERLYEITGIFVNGALKPLFKFTNEIL
jgi:hypothetical protein